MNRENIRKRINLLRQRTTGRGCTEAEAMEAATKAAELMREHGLSDDELSMGQEAALLKSAVNNARSVLWPVIALCTNTAALISARDGDKELVFIGLEPGPEIAVYLFDVCENAVNYEVAKFRKSDFYRRRRTTKTKRVAVNDFTHGLARRLRARLLDLFEDSISSISREKADRELARRFPNTTSAKCKVHRPRFDDALYAGWQAGQNVNLSQGVYGGSTPKMIGRM